MSLEGVLVVDKHAGPTSHDIVEQVRRFTGDLRVGHTGTLDPFATGVLPLCIGRATRLARFISAARKTYAGIIHLGTITDTYDIDGRVVSEKPVPPVDVDAVRAAASRLTGRLMQTPPIYSARRIKGRRMHRLARRGEEVVPSPSAVTIHRFEILEVTGPLVRFEAETSSGTYVRSLAHDLGAIIGCGACLAELCRLASGSFHIGGAHRMEEILRRGEDGSLSDVIIPLRLLDLGLPIVTVTVGGAAAMRAGRALLARDLAAQRPARADGPVRVEDQEGNLLGVAMPSKDSLGDEVLRPDVVLVA